MCERVCVCVRARCCKFVVVELSSNCCICFVLLSVKERHGVIINHECGVCRVCKVELFEWGSIGNSNQSQANTTANNINQLQKLQLLAFMYYFFSLAVI